MMPEAGKQISKKIISIDTHLLHLISQDRLSHVTA